MSRSPEEKLLRRLIEQLDTRGVPSKKGRLDLVWSLLLWIASFCLFLVYFRSGGSTHWTAAMLGAVCLAAGYYLAYQTYKVMYARQWPIIANFVDKARIEERLRELGGV